MSLVNEGYEPLVGAQAELVAHQARRLRLQAVFAHNLLAELAAARAATLEARQEGDEFRSQLDATRSENDVLKEEVRAAKELVAAARADSQDAKFERDAARDEADAAKEEIDSLRAASVTAVAAADEAQALLKTDQARHECSMRNLEAALAERESDMRALETVIAVHGVQSTALESDLEAGLRAARTRADELEQVLLREQASRDQQLAQINEELHATIAARRKAETELSTVRESMVLEQERHEGERAKLESALALLRSESADREGKQPLTCEPSCMLTAASRAKSAWQN
jgi:chromosome segregation ATPase